MSNARSFLFAAVAILTAGLPALAATPWRQADPVPQTYVIGADDVLDVTYWGEKDLSAQVAVRPDGFISLPLLEDIPALGVTPAQLSERIRGRAVALLDDPRVTVTVKQINSRKVYITGEVARPGAYVLGGSTTVLQLIAQSGGLTEFADREHISIIREGAEGPVTFRFNYKRAAKVQDLRENIVLLPGDTVLVR